MAELLEFQKLESKKDLVELLKKNKEENPIYSKVLEKYTYEEELKMLQVELVNLQNWITENIQIIV